MLSVKKDRRISHYHHYYNPYRDPSATRVFAHEVNVMLMRHADPFDKDWQNTKMLVKEAEQAGQRLDMSSLVDYGTSAVQGKMGEAIEMDRLRNTLIEGNGDGKLSKNYLHLLDRFQNKVIQIVSNFTHTRPTC
ncbi:unnamed protein product [Protopolystoma xenopodis]|uniref:Uncharacterized protein n=1 Tax=Protopolystoma xenopodis TaxID=117903 RepID=A0A448X597_9PLAT|nr:unnamed protein product [Protopolystoma xenopodis]